MSNQKRLEWLYTLARQLHQQHLDMPNLARTVLRVAAEAMGAPQGCVITFRDGVIDQPFALGNAPDARMEVWSAFARRGIAGFTQYSRRTVVIRNIATDPRWASSKGLSFIPTNGSAVGVPLTKGDALYAVLLLFRPKIDDFDDETVAFLNEIAEVAAEALGNAAQFESVRMTDDRYQALFEEAVVPIILTDMYGYILDVNRKTCEFLGRERATLLRLSIAAIHRMGTGPLDDRLQTLKTDGSSAFHTTAFCADGKDVPVIVRARQMSLGDRSVIEWVEQDMTAQMELEQLRADLSAMVYHDLRGPLQTIRGSINKLGQVLANHDNPAVLTLLQVGIRSTRQLQRMVDSLLDIQRLEEGKAILNRQAVEVRVLLGDAAQLVLPLAMETGHRLQFDFQPNLPMVEMDSDMIMRVVINLIENGIKYTPDGGVVKLGARVKDGSLHISVRDAGPGIPFHMQRQIFDKFSRVKYQDAPKGVGLGLAFCRLAVEAHHGKIWVESEPGSGAEFIFTLPLNEITAEEAPAVAAVS
jgi:PAS domain S-box-containing protein